MTSDEYVLPSIVLTTGEPDVMSTLKSPETLLFTELIDTTFTAAAASAETLKRRTDVTFFIFT